MNLEREVRKVERCLGIPIEIRKSEDGKPIALRADDSEASGSVFSTILPLSRWKQHIKSFHESIYRARAKRKYELQGGRCTHCQRDMQGRGECDHIVARARGRDDRMENLQIVCHTLSNGCGFHQQKHTGKRNVA